MTAKCHLWMLVSLFIYCWFCCHSLLIFS